MGRIPGKRTVVAVCAVATLALAGCGSDESGQDTTAAQQNTTDAQVSITSPIPPTTTTTAPTATDDAKKKPAQTTTSGGGGTAAACTIPDAYQGFKYTGIDCTAAVALASEWDRNANRCNTIDNPNVDEGYNRTCEVQGFTCRAKRDVKSDARFVNCSKGGQSVRFTWLPA
jgi:hypothetical protein